MLSMLAHLVGPRTTAAVALHRPEAARPLCARPSELSRPVRWACVRFLLALGLLFLAASTLAGCQSYQATWPNGPTIRIVRFGTDAKVGRLTFNPQTGAIELENLDSQTTAVKALADIAAAVVRP